MLEAIDKPRDTLSPHAPRLLSFRIEPELIGTVIGPGGRTIKGITERTNTKIDIEDGGIVTIASHDGTAAEEAQRIIEALTRRVGEGEVFSGEVKRVIPIGAFVEILPGKEGMIHISQLSEARVEKVEDVVNVGDHVTVRVREIDNRGRINLTLRGVPQQEPALAGWSRGHRLNVRPIGAASAPNVGAGFFMERAHGAWVPYCAGRPGFRGEIQDRCSAWPSPSAGTVPRGPGHGWRSGNLPGAHGPGCRAGAGHRHG